MSSAHVCLSPFLPWLFLRVLCVLCVRYWLWGRSLCRRANSSDNVTLRFISPLAALRWLSLQIQPVSIQTTEVRPGTSHTAIRTLHPAPHPLSFRP